MDKPLTPARIIIVMGVSASGKSTIGKNVARRLHLPFLEGDEFHPEANIDKMRNGIALTDEDRWPWLEAMAKGLAKAADRKGAVGGACSALRRAYRDFMVEKAGEPILFVYLDGSREVIGERMATRQHEYMPLSLLDSQFATLEVPDPETENVLFVPVTDSIGRITTSVVNAVGHLRSFKRKQ